MELFDTHFHYYGEGSPREFMQTVNTALSIPPQAPLGTVSRLRKVALGGDFLESCRSREFAQLVEDSWFCVGVHPHMAAEFRAAPADFSEFRGHPKLVGIGELGLDYYYENCDRKIQQSVLQEFLQLALAWNLPAVIHLRDKDNVFDAYEDGYRLLKPFAEAGGRFDIHCFAGTPEWAERFLALGAFLGVTGAVTFRKAENIREIVRMIPDERLLIETDSPYLTPVPHRGQENHPGFVIWVAERVAEVRLRSLEEIAELTTANGCRFFKIERV